MQQESTFSPITKRLFELRKDESGQVMPFTAVFSLFLIVCWLTVYNVGVGVTDKVRLQDMADQMAYSQAIVGARAMNLIALNNRTMIANLVSYTASVIMRSHSKFIRDLTLIIYTIMYLIEKVVGKLPVIGPIVKVLTFVAGLADIAASGWDFLTFGLAAVWRFVLNIQIVWILIPSSKLMFTAFAAVPVLNIAEYQGSAIFRELSNEETATLPSGETDLWTQFGGVQLITGSLTDLLGDSGGGAFSLAGAGLNIAALALQVVSWSSFDNLIELPGGPSSSGSSGGGGGFFGGLFGGGGGSGSSASTMINPDSFLNFLNTDSTDGESNGSAFSFENTSSRISQERRVQWMVSRTYPLSDRDQPIFGVSGVGGGDNAGDDSVDEINSKRQQADALEDEADDLDDEADDLEEEAEELRNEDPPNNIGAAEKEAEAAEKRSQASNKRSEAATLDNEADALQNEMTNADPEDFNIDWNGSVDEPRWGFNRDPLGPLGSMGMASDGFIIGYAIFANAYCLVFHLSPARVSMTFGGETRVGEYKRYGLTSRIQSITGGGFGLDFNIYTMKLPAFETPFEKVPNYETEFEIVGYDFFEVEVEYIDWDIWPSWEREDDISLDIGDAAFSSRLEVPGLTILTDILPRAHEVQYADLVDDIPGFNENFPEIWRGLFHEENDKYNDYYTGFSFVNNITQYTSKAGVDFSPQGFIELDEKHFAEKYAAMFNQKYHYEIQKTGSNEIERRKGKYYVMLGREYKTMRLLRWLGLLDSGGDLLEGVELDGHNGTGVVFNGNDGDTFTHASQGGNDTHYGNYDEAATVTASREFNPHFFDHMVVLSKSEVFFERPSDGRGEIPNLMNAFWSARLAPLQTDVTDFLSELGVPEELEQVFTFALTH